MLAWSLLAVLVVPVFVVSFYYGVGYSALERFVDPSYDSRVRRIIELIIAFYIFVIFSQPHIHLLMGHFHVKESEIPSISSSSLAVVRILLPCCIYAFIRCLVLFHSSRMGRDHLNMIIFLYLVSTPLTIFKIIKERGHYFDALGINPELIGFLAMLSVFVVLILEFILNRISKNPFFNKTIIKGKRLIDLADELPAELHFCFGKDEIKRRIKDLISKNPDNSLRMLVNQYTTVEDNINELLVRSQKSVVCIIGSDDNNLELNDKLNSYNDMGIRCCRGGWDKIRVIIDGEKRLLASFATSGNKDSHVGIYSEHPFIVSLFVNYFDTKCKSIKGCNATNCKKMS